MNPSWLVFIVGLIPLGIAYESIKQSLPSWGLVIVASTYLTALRLLSDFIGKKTLMKASKSNDKNKT